MGSVALLCLVAVAVAVGGCQKPGGGPGRGAGLTGLHVAAGAGLYPAFDPEVLHYAVRCADDSMLRVAVQAQDSDATLRMLHDGSTATGSMRTSVRVNSDHDIAIEVSGARGSATYVLHCIPPDFPDITLEARTAAVSDGVLLMTPGLPGSGTSFLAIVDNNGVPRSVMRPNMHARNFRRIPDGRYSFAERTADDTESIVILNGDFERIGAVTLAGGLDPRHTGGLDFLVLENGNYLLMTHYPAVRDLSAFRCGGPMPRQCSTMEPSHDSIIQEVTPDGKVVFEWNSWDHVKIEDCTSHRFPNDYAHLNSLHELDGDELDGDDLDGDIVAGLRGCAQVLRIERSTGSGAAVWQMGGSLPMRDNRPRPSSGATEYLAVVGDPEGEFCGQHQVTATPAGSVLMFDNGDFCLGPRKAKTPVTRIVEYDISSGTEARFVREYRLPAADGFAVNGGGVVALKNGNWLITWGNNGSPLAVSEVSDAGNQVLRMNIAKDGEPWITARVYREPESAVKIPLNLPQPQR